MEGQVKFYRVEKGFGFIEPRDGGKDVFFHVSQVAEGDKFDLKKFDEVEFEMGQSDKGPCALLIKRI